MKLVRLIIVFMIILMSCEKSVTEPDPTKFSANQTILSEIYVNTIAFDNDGTAWIGTADHGLVKYSLTKTKFYNSQNSISGIDAITDIAIDSKNNIWIAAEGLIKYDGERFYRFNAANSDIPENHIRSIAINSKGDVWIATGTDEAAGLASYDGENFKVFGPKNSPLPDWHTVAITTDNEDNIWVSAAQGEINSYLVKISGESWTVYDSVDFKQKIYLINDLDIGYNNQVYGAIEHSPYDGERYPSPHIIHFDGSHFNTYSIDSVRSSFPAIMVDRLDKLWYTFGYGYAYFDGDQWNRTESELVNNTHLTGFYTIEQAPDGNIWIGTNNGIQIFREID